MRSKTRHIYRIQDISVIERKDKSAVNYYILTRLPDSILMIRHDMNMTYNSRRLMNQLIFGIVNQFYSGLGSIHSIAK